MAASDFKIPELQAIAYHMFTKCKDERVAFDDCMDQASKSSQCAEQQKALSSCAKNLISEAVGQAAHQFKEYAHCLDLTNGRYPYCRPEKAKFDEAYPLE